MRKSLSTVKLYLFMMLFSIAGRMYASQPSQTPLMKHIMFFAKNGTLSYESMIAAHKSLGFEDSALLKLKIQAILNFSKADGKEDELIEGVSKFAKELENMPNQASAGIWKVGGEIDYAVLNSLCDQAVDINGTPAITKELIESHLKAHCEAEENRGNVCSSISTWVWYGLIPLPIPWTRVTSGSFDELFRYLGDIDGRDDAITVVKFRRFYEDSDEVLEELRREVSPK